MAKIIDKLNKIKNHSVLKNIMKMMTGTMLGQVISIIMVPISSRIYGAELYGDLAVFTSASSVCTSVLGFGLASAIMVEKTDYESMQTYKLAVNLTNLFVFFVAATALIIAPIVQFVKSSLPYPIMIIMLSFYVMTTNQINMLYAWLNRKGRYNVLLFNPIIAPLVNNGLVITLGLTGFTHIGLYVGLIASQFLTLLHMFLHMDKIDYKLKYSEIKVIIQRNKDFILYQYPASMMNTVVSNLPIQILSACFGNTVVGYYSMAMKLLNIPSNIISTSMSRIYFKEATDVHHSGGNARGYTYKLCKLVMSIFLVPIVGILVLGNWAIPLFLGSDWMPSVDYIKIMAIWNLFAIFSNCTAGFPSIIGKQKINMLVSLTRLCIFPVVMLGLSYVFRNPYITLIGYVIAYAIINTIYYETLIGEDIDYKHKFIRLGTFFGAIVATLYLLFNLNWFL